MPWRKFCHTEIQQHQIYSKYRYCLDTSVKVKRKRSQLVKPKYALATRSRGYTNKTHADLLIFSDYPEKAIAYYINCDGKYNSCLSPRFLYQQKYWRRESPAVGESSFYYPLYLSPGFLKYATEDESLRRVNFSLEIIKFFCLTTKIRRSYC